MTPLQYLTHRRLSNAQQLLDNQQESRLSLKEIAFLSGFDDYYYFSRVFKQELDRNETTRIESEEVIAMLR